MEIDASIIIIIVVVVVVGWILIALFRIERFDDIKSENITNKINNSEKKMENTSCNLEESKKLNERVINYNKIYGGLYNHQINNCNNLNCDIDKDIIGLNNIMLENNNARECVSCINNQKPINLAEKLNDVINSEKEAIRNKQNAENNMEKFTNFNNLVYQNTSNVESPNDKMAEIRLTENNTCGLLNYGKKVADVYDNLLANTNKDNNNYSMDSVFAYDNSNNIQAEF
jgi:hypothetical protein